MQLNSILIYLIFIPVLLLSCAEGMDPGTFSIIFEWEDPPPENTTELGIWGRVERDGLQIAESEVVSYRDGINLDFGDVPNGEQLVVVIEVKEGLEKSSRAMYFGMSDAFTLEPGKHTEVSVDLQLSSTPKKPEGVNSDAVLTILEALETGGYVKSNNVTLLFHAEKAATVLLANDEDFLSTSLLERRLEYLEKDDAGRYKFSGWDLNAGLVDTEDGARAVFIKFKNEYGYESETVSQKIILDTHPPTDGTISSERKRLISTGPEDLLAEMVYAVIGADEMWVEACKGSCMTLLDRIPSGVLPCQSEDKFCLPALNAWTEYKTRGWIRLANENIEKIRVKYRDFAGNMTDWLVFEFEAVSIVDIDWIKIPSGTFQMGCVPHDSQCDYTSMEYPRHSVIVSAFEMSATEITQEQYETMTGSNPSERQNCPTCPIEMVDWYQAKTFCETVGGRLPSEAEWEYAARAGTESIYICGDDVSCLDDISWWVENSEGSTHPVATKDPNAFGLYDMCGNISEWVEDCWHWSGYHEAPGTGGVWEGGACGDYVMVRDQWVKSFSVDYYRASFRYHAYPTDFGQGIGFRCAR